MSTERTFIGVRIPVQINKRIEKLAARDGESRSSVVRRLLSAAVQREEQRGDVLGGESK